MPLTRTLLTTEYTMLRLPLTVLEDRVVTRYLEEDSRLRLGFERALGTLDATVGRLVGDAELTRRGGRLSHRAGMLEKAVVLEEKAHARREQANASLHEAKAVAEHKRTAARRRAQEDVKALKQDQQVAKQAAARRATTKAEAASEAARRRAAAKVDAIEDAAEQQAERVEALAEARAVKPVAQLRDAGQLAQQARQERAAAERLSELADEQKARRKS